ncbi:DUF1360 domain-containing protein [Patulibacter sp. NPDC049589]|uniref:DUF1360 domain-containing protein n=1 Tax=Patulibacter sp. NPDC049589 TaxID=3154731 RepID=UPI003427B45F
MATRTTSAGGSSSRPERPSARDLAKPPSRFRLRELLSCARCTGSWVGLGLLGLHVASPRTARVVAAAGAIGAVNDTALAGFAWLASRANAAEEDADAAAEGR